MRGGLPRRTETEEEENVFIPMTDMTVSFLFIVMILLAFFASQFSTDDTVPRSIQREVIAERDRLRLDVARLEAERDELSASLSDARETVEERGARIAELERRLDRLRSDLDEARDMIERLRTERDTAVADRERLSTELSRARDSIAAYEDRIADLKSRLNALRTDLEDAEEELERRESRIAELERALAEVRERLAELEVEARDPLEAYLARVAAQRARLLVKLKAAIEAEFEDLVIEISAENDALRFQGEGLFRSGSVTVRRDRRNRIRRIAAILDDLLPCYSLGPRSAFSETCNPAFALVESLQVEGHTDSDGSNAYNIGLSASRGAQTYGVMTKAVPGLVEHRNIDGQPVLSVAGYGEGRPIEPNDTPRGKAANRRIDLRFIMVTPTREDEIPWIRERLREGGLTAAQ